jgi:hypothetical protein
MRVSLRRASLCIELVQRNVILPGINMKMKQPIVGVLEDRSGILEALTTKDGLKLLEGPAVHHGWLLLRFCLGEKFLHINLMSSKVFLMTLDLMMLICHAQDIE